MGVYIKGMTIPQTCRQCFYKASGCPCNKHNQGRPTDCPLVEVKPHGRLIDADAFMEYECHNCDGYCDVCECDCLNCKNEHRCSFMQSLNDAPTIIEAEVQDES